MALWSVWKGRAGSDDSSSGRSEQQTAGFDFVELQGGQPRYVMLGYKRYIDSHCKVENRRSDG
jgi:hypothetical protein